MENELVVVPRQDKGKRAAKKMRKEGRIPAVLYGHGFDTMLLSMDEREFKALMRKEGGLHGLLNLCLLYTSPSPRDLSTSRMPSSA